MHYFDSEKAPDHDFQLGMAKMQGYVPQTCLLGGIIVMSEVNAQRDPCAGCNGPRYKCHGRSKIEEPRTAAGSLD